MMDFLNSWLVWAGLGGGTLGLIVLAVLAPSALQVVTTFASGIVSLAVPLLEPAASAVGRFVGLAFSALATGALRVLDDGKQIGFVATIVLAAYGFGQYAGHHGAREKVIQELHQQFKFIPKRR